jgi:hypothetical protein
VATSYPLNIIAGVLMIAIAVLQFTPKIIDSPGGKFVVIGIALLAAMCVIVSGLLAWFAERSRKREEQLEKLERAKRETLIERRLSEQSDIILQMSNNLNIVVLKLNETKAASLKSSPRDDLRTEVTSLGRDILEFLKSKGPKPELPPMDSHSSVEKILDDVIRRNGPWVEGIHYGYDHKFKDRVAKLVSQLREQGVRDDLNFPLDPQVFNADLVRRVGESLIRIGAQMEIREISGK